MSLRYDWATRGFMHYVRFVTSLHSSENMAARKHTSLVCKQNFIAFKFDLKCTKFVGVLKKIIKEVFDNTFLAIVC